MLRWKASFKRLGYDLIVRQCMIGSSLRQAISPLYAITIAMCSHSDVA